MRRFYELVGRIVTFLGVYTAIEIGLIKLAIFVLDNCCTTLM